MSVKGALTGLLQREYIISKRFRRAFDRCKGCGACRELEGNKRLE